MKLRIHESMLDTADLTRRFQGHDHDHAEWLFASTFADLRASIITPEVMGRYEFMKLAQLLRKLLLEKHPLVEVAQRRYNAGKPVYMTTPSEEPDDSDHPEWITFLAPGGANLADGDAPRNRETFLSTNATWTRAGWLTVRDLIKFFAHVDGAVHLGTPKTDADKLTVAAVRNIANANLDAYSTLYFIAVSVVRALTPQYDLLMLRSPAARDEDLLFLRQGSYTDEDRNDETAPPRDP